MFDFRKFTEEKEKVVDYMARDMRAISTGLATPQILDMVKIEIYGSRMAVPHVASINIEDPRTLRVSPYDKDIIPNLERAINEASLGVSVNTDSDGLRIYFPQMTTESRERNSKTIKEKFEEARVKIRSIREEIKKEIEKMSRDGEFGKDNEERFLGELQNNVDLANKELEQIFFRKEKEIMGEE